MSQIKYESDGWVYRGNPDGSGDNRKLITGSNQGMEWVGIAVWSQAANSWFQGNSPFVGEVKAWRDLPDIARGFWQRGVLVLTFAEKQSKLEEDRL